MIVENGFNLIRDLAVGRSSKVYSEANANIAIGNSSTAAASGDTALVSEKARLTMESNYPNIATTKRTIFKGTAQSAEANVHWAEFGIFNSAAGGTLMSHTVSDKGTKASPEVWTLEVRVDMSGA